MNVIAAVYNDWGIGSDGKQPIVIPEDRKFFKGLTIGGVVVAGRMTFEAFAGPLPNRKNIVLTRNKDYIAEGAVVVHSVTEALGEISGDSSDRIFIAGGGDIFRLFLPLCVFAYVTKIEASPLSDTFFPELDALPGWSLERRGNANVSCGVRYSFNLYKNDANAPAVKEEKSV